MSIADKLVTIAENQQRVYDKGYADGSVGGGDENATFNALVTGELEHAVLPDGITQSTRGVFYEKPNLKSVTLPNGFKSIYSYFCYNCDNLENVNLVDTIEVIYGNAFYSCDKLIITKLPANLKVIETNAFNGCKAATFNRMPSIVRTINTSAFANCTGLTTLTFEGKPTTIAANAFNGCANLTTINVPWAEGAVANAPWGATNAKIHYNHDPDATVFYMDDGTTWAFEEGMTWAEFVDSEYNTGDAFYTIVADTDGDGDEEDAIAYGPAYVYDGDGPVNHSSPISVGEDYHSA